MGNYETDTPGVEAGDNGSIRLDLDNEPQPDAFLIILPERGGQARISEDDYIEGAPELVAEVASSSASYDLGKKLNVYRRNGVREYVVWRVLDRQVDWFVNRDGRFEPMPPAADGILRSTVFPGLWLDPAALVRARRRPSRRSSSEAWTPPSMPTSWPDWSGSEKRESRLARLIGTVRGQKTRRRVHRHWLAPLSRYSPQSIPTQVPCGGASPDGVTTRVTPDSVASG